MRKWAAAHKVKRKKEEAGMAEERAEKKGWSPYVAGALVGLLMVLSIWVTGKYFGASTTFVRSAGLVEMAFDGQRVAAMEYFKKEVPKIDWQWMFVVGIFFGSLIAATSSKTFRLKAVPPMWESRFGPGKLKRGITAFLGGVIAMFGARLADG
jgi:uncharacterized protein